MRLGLIGYRGALPVGWISLGPREDFAKLANSLVMKAVNRKRKVKLLEAYPVVEGESLWFGVASMFTAAGFVEVARRRPDRPVMRLRLAARGASCRSSGCPSRQPRPRRCGPA